MRFMRAPPCGPNEAVQAQGKNSRIPLSASSSPESLLRDHLCQILDQHHAEEAGTLLRVS